ncbi:MAG: hypothetical protein LBC53_09575 [Spirochaetaceae bacterium]|nr:hypothetical protein [Spirochaetaceae bacterium]
MTGKMDFKKAKELALEKWEYLAKYPEAYKLTDLPDALYKKLVNLSFYCPLCEIFMRADGCNGCPLDGAGQNCYDKNSLFRRWMARRSAANSASPRSSGQTPPLSPTYNRRSGSLQTARSSL